MKYIAYSAWSYYGFQSLRKQSSIGAALGFGFVRLGLGILFGVAIFFVGGALHLGAPRHPWLLYLAIYAPVRYGEWSILAALLGAKGGEVYGIGDRASQRWIVGGIIVSHLADLPMILLSFLGPTGFLPVGRFLC